MSATAHTGESIRSEAIARRKVYKNVIDSPFALKWPAVSSDLNESILDNLIKVLEPIGQHRRVVAESKRKKQKGDDATTTTPAYPDIHQRVCIGINDVTKLLENAIQSKTKRPNTAIFVCKRDMKPPHLCSHLLTMAPLTSTKIVSLPQGAEIKLAKALGLQRASCIAVDIVEGKEERLRLDMDEVPIVDAPWITGDGGYQPTNIKVLETSAPIKPKKRPAPPLSNDSQQQQPLGKKAKR
ncbi:hypothetical protein O0I10_007257 [Lichtheimia ornata]|uniref:Uncharacterized protein n=1 Tax=Lichtheimia ornata TaxID=688661 RepID=A0AAD7V1H4_9FUNG|nr:uncharacterized protein O0I10_007257 [Lichtheimia ornata]KAJ8656923.1 hypothetical protein O0I10_007257 [Lichtheimia ornata]